jgi:dimethylargininase
VTSSVPSGPDSLRAMPRALVRRPGPKLADGLVTHIDPSPIDVEIALDQWQRYVAVLAEHGWETTEVEPADDCPDAVFVEDAVVVFDDLAVVTRPGADSRRPETAGAERAARAAGLEIHRITEPGLIDGGDVLKVVTRGEGGVRKTAYVGIGGRTNPEAVAQLALLLAPRGWFVRPVPVRKVLHLKSAVTALPDGTIIGYPALVDDPSAFDRFLAVPEPEGAHVVLVGGNRLLVSANAPKSAALFRSMGYEPVCVDIGEFEKLEGCVTCLSVRIRD